MSRLFQKGQPRPAKAGRRAGTPNKNSQMIGQFCREVLETPEFQLKWHRYFTETPVRRMNPRLLALAFAYAYGRPREHVEVSDDNSTVEFTLDFGLPPAMRQLGHVVDRGEVL